MSTATVRSVIARFLSTETPEVLALKGAWGVGKTYAWSQLVKELKDGIKVRDYCYVSLFGISSLRELRLAIFANTKPVRLIAAWSALRSFGCSCCRRSSYLLFNRSSTASRSATLHALREASSGAFATQPKVGFTTPGDKSPNGSCCPTALKESASSVTSGAIVFMSDSRDPSP